MTDIRQAVTRMTLDLALQDTGKSLACTKGDVNRRLEFTLQDGGKPFYVPRGWTAFLGGVKPDGTRLYNGCVIERGIILYDFASGPEISTCAGIFPITVDLFDEEGEAVASPAIWLHVKDNGRDLASEDQFTYLQDLLGRLHEAEGEIDQLENTDIGHASQISANAQSIGEQGQRIEENSRVLLGHAALLKEINDKLEEGTGVNEEMVRDIVTGELAQYDTGEEVSAKISAHNTDPEAHRDLREELLALSTRLNTALNSEDVDLDQLSEIVAYIKSNKTLIDAITTAKVSKSEIVNDLVTNLGDRPLSAAQGVALKALIDELAAKVVTSVPTFDLAGMGLPTIPMEGEAVEVTTSTAAIIEALRRGALVQFTVNLNYRGMTFNGVTMAVHGSESGEGIYTCTYAWSPYLVGEQYPMIITIIVEETKITGMARFMWTEAEVPSEIDLSAFESDGTIVETYADGTTKTTTMEFDEDGNPVKITDADGNETILTW